jgi:thioredoxin reductase (NADPH)
MGLNTLLIEKGEHGGQITITSSVTNYLGFEKITGQELSKIMHDHVKSTGIDIAHEEVVKTELSEDIKVVYTHSGEYKAKSVIIGIGTSARNLGVDNEKSYVNNGISFSSLRDREKYSDKPVAVVGGGNSALQEAVLLSDLCEKVYVFQNPAFFTGEKKLLEILASKSNVELMTEVTVKELKGDGELTGVVLNTIMGEKEVDLDGLFVAIGLEPKNSAFAEIAGLDENGYFDSDEKCVTKTEGIFVAGDCRQKSIRQITTASADGAVAALAACRYIDNK